MKGDADNWWNDALQEKQAADVCRKAGMWKQCYHHAGQSIEFALKAIYLKRHGLDAMPDHCKGARWHSLDFIKDNAQIEAHFGSLKSDKVQYSYWLIVKDWDSNARFPGSEISKQEVNDLLVAAFNPTKGIFGWLETIFQKN